MNEQSREHRMLSTKDAAARIGVAPRTLREYVDSKIIPHYRYGKRLAFDPKEVERFKALHKVEAR